MSAANFQFAIANIVVEPSLVKLKNSLALPTEHARSGRTTHHFSATLESQPSRRSHQGYATREHDKDKENDQVLQQHSAQGRTISVSLGNGKGVRYLLGCLGISRCLETGGSQRERRKVKWSLHPASCFERNRTDEVERAPFASQ